MKPSRWLRWRPYVAAASVCAVIFGSTLFYFGNKAEQPTNYSALSAPTTEISMEQAADYVMIDNDDIYNYLADY